MWSFRSVQDSRANHISSKTFRQKRLNIQYVELYVFSGLLNAYGAEHYKQNNKFFLALAFG